MMESSSAMPEFAVTVQRSSYNSVELRWTPTPSDVSRVQIYMESISKRDGAKKIFIVSQGEISWKYKSLQAGSEYSFKVTCLKEVRQGCWELVAQSPTLFVHAVCTKDELETLYKKAKVRVENKGNGSKKVVHAYRDKKAAYWRETEADNWTMKAYTKDSHGDPASPLNGQVKGLFFSASVRRKTGKPPNTSLYGPLRLKVDVSQIFNSKTNLYFVDFYCIKKAHYVLLMIARKGSIEDDFCKEKLLSVDSTSNPFMWRRDGRIYVANSAPQVWLEIFYAADLNIQNAAPRRRVSQFSRPKAPGKKKRATCTICSFH